MVVLVSDQHYGICNISNLRLTFVDSLLELIRAGITGAVIAAVLRKIADAQEGPSNCPGLEAFLEKVKRRSAPLSLRHFVSRCPSRLFIPTALSSGSANVFMMQAANTIELKHLALIWRLYPASFRRVLI